jgi:CheY-like chemotaxis protein
MLKGLKALVVDDNATTRFIIREMLAARGTEITEAAGGQEALAELKRAQEAATPYQLLLLDCHMPDLNGFQVAECIKNTPGLAGTTMLMLTSDARDGDLARARGLGSTGYLVKPINRADLLHTITAALSHTQTTAQTATEATGPAALDAQRPLNILLVEDSADNRVLIQAYLKQTSHQLEIAENGARAVEKFQAGRFDLVLMDMQLPVMDGYTATKTIRQWEQTQNRQPTPIIALTAYALKEEAQKSLQAGCMAHLTKPIKKAALLAAIAEYAKRTVNRPVAAGECSS